MPQTLKKLKGHIALGLPVSVHSSVCPCDHSQENQVRISKLQRMGMKFCNQDISKMIIERIVSGLTGETFKKSDLIALCEFRH